MLQLGKLDGLLTVCGMTDWPRVNGEPLLDLTRAHMSACHVVLLFLGQSLTHHRSRVDGHISGDYY